LTARTQRAPDPCADTSFHPADCPGPGRYFQYPLYPDSSCYFTPHGFNAVPLRDSTEPPSSSLTRIRKTYPDLPDPRTLPPDSLTSDMYTEDGYLKFYEYAGDIPGLLPSVPYWVAVTAFDFGSPESCVRPLESAIAETAVSGFPLHAFDAPLSGSNQVYIYPNPYRTDAGYRVQGFEGRAQEDRWDERVRAIWFANLPPQCTIHIYTLNGDRVRTLDHDTNPADPLHTRHAWDLINRNFQKVESGLYYWVVEVPGQPAQIGKLAIIREPRLSAARESPDSRRAFCLPESPFPFILAPVP